jgi:hypothetical protein
MRLEAHVQAGRLNDRQIRHISRRRDVERNLVVKYVSHVPRKAAIVLYVPVP